MTEWTFVGRQRELTRLRTFLDVSFASAGQVVFVTGDAGSGKTALVREFARQAQNTNANLVVAFGDCNGQTGISDPYLPFCELLRLLCGDVAADLTDNIVNAENATCLRKLLVQSIQVLVEISPDLVSVLLPGIPGVGLLTSAGKVLADKAGLLDRLAELIKGKPDAGDGTLEQCHIFEQYTNFLMVLSTKHPLVQVLDDLQRADTASISLLFHLGRRMMKGPILIVGTYRPDEVKLGRGGERHPLEKALAEFKRYFGDVWVNLGQAAQAEGWEFVDVLLDTEPNRLEESFRQALFRHTRGHPLFTTEILRKEYARAGGPGSRWTGTLGQRASGALVSARMSISLRGTLNLEQAAELSRHRHLQALGDGKALSPKALGLGQVD